MSELYDQLSPWVLGVAHRILGDDDEAGEVVSDVFVQVWTNIRQHDAGRGPLVPWILSIARNRALDVLRRRRRWYRKAERLHVEQGSGDESPVADALVRGEAAVPGWPVHQEVHRALAALPEDQRQALTLAYFEGLSQSEIAKRTGTPLGTVKTRMRIAQQKLAEALKHVRDWMD
ncbi:MAG TPA: sigma-70 family RNA polymerase sigma factor [Gemmatimonadales bacterium]|nr:sigma-70 family RNA polymerase sigma factor [Gemmatimonadales bacterium]